MSNARNLANLLGTNTTIQTAKLADSSISTAKLADSAISTAKLADDAITAAKLSSSAITAADVPAGTILQVATKNCTSNGATISTTNYTAVGMDITITPKRSGSHFLYQAFWLTYDNATTGTMKVESAMFRGSTNISGNLTHTPYNGEGDAGRMPYGGISQLDTGAGAVAGTPISYSYKFKKQNSNDVSYDIAHNDAKSAFLTIMEIAQ